MYPEDEWDVVRNDRGWSFASLGSGMLRATLLFGSAAIALALIVAPMLEGDNGDYMAQSGNGYDYVDRTVTGTVRYKGTYTIRKSVLQTTPESECVIRDNGIRSGDC